MHLLSNEHDKGKVDRKKDEVEIRVRKGDWSITSLQKQQ